MQLNWSILNVTWQNVEKSKQPGDENLFPLRSHQCDKMTLFLSWSVSTPSHT